MGTAASSSAEATAKAELDGLDSMVDRASWRHVQAVTTWKAAVGKCGAYKGKNKKLKSKLKQVRNQAYAKTKTFEMRFRTATEAAATEAAAIQRQLMLRKRHLPAVEQVDPPPPAKRRPVLPESDEQVAVEAACRGAPAKTVRARGEEAPPPAKRRLVPPECSNVCAFWAACRGGTAKMGHVIVQHNKQKVRFETIDMPDGVELPWHKSLVRLLVRPHYRRLYDSFMGTGGAREVREDSLTGTPGTGTSLFLLYVLWCLGLEKHEHPIVFQTADGQRFLFHGDKVEKGGLQDFNDELENKNCVYLVDGSEHSLPHTAVPARTFLATPLNEEVYGQFATLTGLQPRIGPLCTLHELLAMRKITPFISHALTPAEVVRAFEVTGGVARPLRDWANHKCMPPEMQVGMAMEECSLNVCKRVIRYGAAPKTTASHSLFHLHPLPDNERRYKVEFASPYAGRKFKAHMTREAKETLQLLNSMPPSPP